MRLWFTSILHLRRLIVGYQHKVTEILHRCKVTEIRHGYKVTDREDIFFMLSLTVPSPTLGLNATVKGPLRAKPEVGGRRQLISQSSRNFLLTEEGGCGKGKWVWSPRASSVVVLGVGVPESSSDGSTPRLPFTSPFHTDFVIGAISRRILPRRAP